MALIQCPECQKEVSSSAHACPGCGFPVAERMAFQSGNAAKKDELVLEVRPSWWGYFWHWVFFFLIIPPIIAYFRRGSTVLRVYPERIRLERGLFSKCVRDYNPRDIRAVDVDQNFFQRMAGIGDLTISTAATAEAFERINSIPDPAGVRDLIVAQRAG